MEVRLNRPKGVTITKELRLEALRHVTLAANLLRLNQENLLRERRVKIRRVLRNEGKRARIPDDGLVLYLRQLDLEIASIDSYRDDYRKNRLFKHFLDAKALSSSSTNDRIIGMALHELSLLFIGVDAKHPDEVSWDELWRFLTSEPKLSKVLFSTIPAPDALRKQVGRYRAGCKKLNIPTRVSYVERSLPELFNAGNKSKKVTIRPSY